MFNAVGYVTDLHIEACAKSPAVIRNPQFSTDLAKFTEEIFDRKLNFSCTEQILLFIFALFEISVKSFVIR